MTTRQKLIEEIRGFLRTSEGTELSDTYFNIHETSVINVLVVGRSQSGKTTLVSALKDSAYSAELRGYSQTRNAQSHPIIVQDRTTDKYYHVNMIDTVGLDEHSQDPKTTRSNNEILNLVAKFVENEITTLNAVIFVSKAADTHINELPALRSLMEFLGPSFAEKSMMVLTHCERLTNEAFQDLARSIKENKASRDIADYCKLGIHPHGTLDINQLETMADDQVADLRIGTVKQKFKMITPMRRRILQLIIGQAGKTQAVRDLQEIINLANLARIQFVAEEMQKRAASKPAEPCVLF